MPDSARARLARLFLIAVLPLVAASAHPMRLAGQLASPSVASEQPLRGRVLKEGQPVPDVEVTLHRVTSTASGAVATTTTDASGRFRFDLPPVDSVGFTVFFATAEYHRVRHFGPPLHPNEARTAYEIEVFDTTSVMPAGMRIGRRDLVLIPQTDGGWEVNEVVRVHNPAQRTLVSEAGMPSLELRLPESAADFELGEGDIPPDQVRRMGDRVLLLMPLLPGDLELFFRYRLPGQVARSSFALTLPADTMNVFVRQPSPRLAVDGLGATDVVTVQGERFLQFSGTGLGTEERVRLSWSAAGAAPVRPVVAGVALTVLVLLLGTFAAVRSRGRRERAAA